MMFVSIIIPVYNHEKIIKQNVAILLKCLNYIPTLEYEILLINDGSTDNSQYEMEKIKENHVIKVNKENGGIGTVLETGLQRGKGEFMILFDLDLSYDINNLRRLIELSTEWDCVVGSKYNFKNKYPFLRRCLSFLLYSLITLLLGIKVRDIGSGLVILRSDFMNNVKIKSKGFGVHLELFLILKHLNARILEIPVYYNHIPGSFKIFSHGCKTIIEIVKLIFHYKMKNL